MSQQAALPVSLGIPPKPPDPLGHHHICCSEAGPLATYLIHNCIAPMSIGQCVGEPAKTKNISFQMRSSNTNCMLNHLFFARSVSLSVTTTPTSFVLVSIEGQTVSYCSCVHEKEVFRLRSFVHTCQVRLRAQEDPIPKIMTAYAATFCYAAIFLIHFGIAPMSVFSCVQHVCEPTKKEKVDVLMCSSSTNYMLNHVFFACSDCSSVTSSPSLVLTSIEGQSVSYMYCSGAMNMTLPVLVRLYTCTCARMDSSLF